MFAGPDRVQPLPADDRPGREAPTMSYDSSSAGIAAERPPETADHTLTSQSVEKPTRVRHQFFAKHRSICLNSDHTQTTQADGTRQIVTIDCGGFTHRTFIGTLRRKQYTRLWFLSAEGSELRRTGTIFLDRNPVVFTAGKSTF